MYSHYQGYRSIFDGMRKLFGYTQSELAQKIGKTQNYLTLVETGRAKSAPVINKIAKLFKISPTFLTEDPRDPLNPIFLSNYYFFTLKRNDFRLYIFLLTCLSTYSSVIEIVYKFSDAPLSSDKRFGLYFKATGRGGSKGRSKSNLLF